MANVKHKENGQWVTVGKAPLHAPMTITRILPVPLPNPIEAGDTVVLTDPTCWNAITDARSSGYQNTGVSIMITRAGTYRFRWGMSFSSGAKARLYKNGTAVGSEHVRNTTEYTTETEVIECAAGDVISLWISPYVYSSRYYYGSGGGLTASISWPALEDLLQ